MAKTTPVDAEHEIKRQFKVLRLRIVKPVNMGWNELGAILREVQYRVRRLANLSLTERYLALAAKDKQHLVESVVNETAGKLGEKDKAALLKRLTAITGAKTSALNKLLAELLTKERTARASKSARVPTGPTIDDARLCADGALMSYVTDALDQKIAAETKGDKWKQVLTGERALPTYKQSIPIPLRGGENKFTPLARETINGQEEVVFEPRLCVKPYPKFIVSMPEQDVGGHAVLKRLLEPTSGYRQRSFEIKRDKWKKGVWWLLVAYDMPVASGTELDPNRIVGVDVGFSCPLFAALSDGWQRLGQQEFGGLGAEVRRLRLRTIAQRRAVQRAGKRGVEDPQHPPARSGHGVARKLLPTEKFQDRIDEAQTTLNHRMSAAVVKFAQQHRAGVIQMENLAGLAEQLRGSFLGANWRYFQLQTFVESKAKAAGIKFRKVNPRYSSRRCSCCGKLRMDFSREFRDQEKRRTGADARFQCPDETCENHKKPLHADYNAARNLAVAEIEKVIRNQCISEGIEYDSHGSLTSED